MRGQTASEVGEVVGPTVALITRARARHVRGLRLSGQIAGESMEGARWQKRRKIYPPGSSTFEVSSSTLPSVYEAWRSRG